MKLDLLETKTENLEIDATELSSEQLRLIRSINTMLTHAMTTESEKEYFNASSDLLRLVAMAVKKANFSAAKKESSIDYEKQVLEYCADSLMDHIHADKLTRFDN